MPASQTGGAAATAKTTEQGTPRGMKQGPDQGSQAQHIKDARQEMGSTKGWDCVEGEEGTTDNTRRARIIANTPSKMVTTLLWRIASEKRQNRQVPQQQQVRQELSGGSGDNDRDDRKTSTEEVTTVRPTTKL